MFGWALSFFVLAAFAAYLGFFTLVGAAAMFMQTLMLAFLVLIAASGLIGLVRDEPPL